LQDEFEVELVKVTPSEAGLGGGSSNAATVMFAANRLLGQPATLKQLGEWCGEIGSDISFFFSSGTAYCTGRGEIFERVDSLPTLPEYIYIVKPAQGLSTPAVFREFNLSQVHHRNPREILQSFTRPITPLNGPILINDLETPAFSCDPSLRKLKERLREVFRNVMMSGSGSSFFGFGAHDPAIIEQQWTHDLIREWPDIKVFRCSPSRRDGDCWYEPTVTELFQEN